MMYPRLKLARNLLTDDGTIAVSIDDCEMSSLVALLSEVFGATNHVATIIWEKMHTRKNSARLFSVSHDYIVLFAKNIGQWDRQLFPRENTDAYRNPDNDPRGPWKPDPITANNPYEADYVIEKPDGIRLSRPPGQYWRLSEETLQEKIETGAILWGSGDSYPMVKRFLTDVQDGLVPVTLWDKEFAGDNRHGKAELTELLGPGMFPYPKPTRLLRRLMQVTVRPGDTVLDYFAGSSSTAHAVMLANAADSGNRKYIMIQLDEQADESSEAAKAGFTTISALARERIRRAAARIASEAASEGHAPDLGFRATRVDTTNILDVTRAADDIEQDQLDLLAENIKSDRTAEDLLFQVLLDWGLELSMPHLTQHIEGYTVFDVEDGALVACFDKEISPVLVQRLAEKRPLRAVFRDAGFRSDADRINAAQAFAEISPSTDVKTI